MRYPKVVTLGQFGDSSRRADSDRLIRNSNAVQFGQNRDIYHRVGFIYTLAQSDLQIGSSGHDFGDPVRLREFPQRIAQIRRAHIVVVRTWFWLSSDCGPEFLQARKQHT